MTTIQRARAVLAQAQASLHELLREALEQQRFGDVAEIAQIADAVAALLRDRSSRVVPQPSASPSSLPSRTERGSSKSRAVEKGSASKDYPRFEKDGDKLVKIGWSKKHRDQYEHRAPRAAALTVVQHLASHAEDGQLFAIEDLLPVQDIANGELPAYQVYLVLAWLRKTGVIEKKGRDGYILRSKATLDDGLGELWDNLPTRQM